MSLLYPRQIHPVDIQQLVCLSISDIKERHTKTYYYACDVMKNWWIVKYEDIFYSEPVIRRKSYFDKESWKDLNREMSWFSWVKESIFKEWTFYEPAIPTPPGFTSDDLITEKLMKQIPDLFLPPPVFPYEKKKKFGSANLHLLYVNQQQQFTR